MVGGATYTPTATATSGLAVTITVDASSSAVCSINGGGVVSYQAVGTCTLDANQTGNGTYYAAPQVQQGFTVGKGNQTITFTSTAPGNATVGGATYTAAATASSGLTVTFTSGSAGVCTSGGTNGSVFTFIGAGTCIVDANQAGNANYNVAPQVQQTFAVKSNQTISFTSANPSPVTVGGAPYTPTATATSGLAVALTLDATSTGCTLTAGVVNFTAVGTCVVDANQAGNGTWNAAPQVQQSITVNKGNQTISFTSANPSPVTVGGAPYTPTATATSGLAVAFTLDATSTGCTLTAGVVNFTAVGTCKIDANQAGNGTWNAAPQVQQSITVNKGNQTITFTSTAPGSAAVGGATYTAAATATSGLTVTFTSGSAGVCTSGGTNGSVFTFVGSGTCIVDANQAGNGNWNAAPQVQQTFTVKNNQTITFTSTAPGSASAGGAPYTPTATATSGLGVSITLDGTSTGCTLSAGVVSFQAAGSCVLDANQAGSATYYAAPQVQQSFAVTGLTITSDQSSGSTATNPRMTLSGTGAAGSSSVSVTICTVNTFPCPFGGTTVTTAAGPTNPWTTAATGATALNYATTYYAQAIQGAQTSPVFTFATPAQTVPTAVALANGTGTARTVDPGDTATVTFSAQLNATTLCSTWTNTGTQTLTNATITFTNAGNNDTFAATSASCTGNGNFGTVSTGGNYISALSGTVTFTNSTITWNPVANTLTFKMGAAGGGTPRTNVTAGGPGYTVGANVTDVSGIPVSTTPFTSGTTSGF